MKRLLFALTLVFVPALAHADEQHFVDIFRPDKVVYPVAMPEFQADGAGDPALATQIPDAIAADLQFTGLFRVLDRGSYLEAKGSVKPTGEGVKWDDWRVLKAQVLIRGAYRSQPGSVAGKVWLWNVVDGSKIGEQQASDTTPAGLEAKLADAIYQQLTGEKSFFGSQLVYVNDRTGSKEIWVAGFDGRGEQQITRNRSINLSPSWSPEGARLVFTSYVRGRPDLYVYDRRVDKFYRITERGGVNIGAVWSPLGRVIAATLSDRGDSDIYLMTEDGKGPKKLTDSFANDVSPTWSPDAKRIAFVSDRGGSPNVYSMNPDGSDVKRLTFEDRGATKDNQAPNWSPRGDRIAFQSRVSGHWQVFTMKTDGTDVHQLTADGSNEDPSWSPDGRMIAFAHDGKLWVMEADGTNARAIGTTGSYSNVSWGPRPQ